MMTSGIVELDLHGMNKGEKICDLAEGAAHKFKVEPDPGKPGRYIREQCTANTAHLLAAEDASAQKAKRDLEDGRGDNQQKGVHDIYRNR